jgi:hypothetical protein
LERLRIRAESDKKLQLRKPQPQICWRLLGWGSSNQYKGKANLAASNNDALVLWMGMEGCQMTKDEALDLALETLESIQAAYPCETVGKRITAIKQARSAPVQEPVEVVGMAKILGDRLAKEHGVYLTMATARGLVESMLTTPPAAQRQCEGCAKIAKP